MSAAPDKHTRATAGQSDGAAVLCGLGDDELAGLLDRLRYFAAKYYYGTLNVEDLAMQAIADVLAGKRAWDAAYPPFENLCWIVRSIASNQLNKEKQLLSYDAEGEAGSRQIEPSTPPHESPSEIYETDEARRGLRALIQRAVGDDNLLRRAVKFFFEREVWKPKEISVELGVSEREIYEAKRRLRRRPSEQLNKS